MVLQEQRCVGVEGPCEECSEALVRAHICGLVPASDVYWLGDWS
jgi:hypothetical protein